MKAKDLMTGPAATVSAESVALARQALGGEALAAIGQPRVYLGAGTGPIGRNPLPPDFR